MKQKRRQFIYGICFISVMGCAQTGPAKELSNSASVGALGQTIQEDVPLQKTNTGPVCRYEELSGSEYRLTNSFAKFASNMFFFNPDVDGGLEQLKKSAYTALANQNFKVQKTGVLTANAKRARASYLSAYRYTEVSLNGELYKIDKGNSTKIITEDCSVFYYKVGDPPSRLETSIVQANGGAMTIDQYIKLIGPESLVAINTNAEVELDRFTKDYKIRTPYFDNMLLRATLNASTNELRLAQLYSDLIFFGDWGAIRNAIDTESTLHDIVKIDTDVDCSNSDLVGCRMTETVGVTFTEDYLRRNANGFELRFQGKKTREVKVPAVLVKSLLDGIDLARVGQL